MATDQPSADVELRFDDLLCFSLYAGNLAMSRVYQPVLKALQLTYPQYLVMLALWLKDGQLVGDIGRQLQLESNTLSPMLKRLQTLGYIEKRRGDQDERQVAIHLTQAGDDLRRKAECIPEQIISATGMTIPELKDLIAKLGVLRANLQAHLSAESDD